jgi:RHH-type proline utilization regulon transcriptional repressor/proline dehydrogenase/delta 1-pyrroline-5-carboxylate dehydrogenase
MLGEGARTARTTRSAISTPMPRPSIAIGHAAGNKPLPNRPGISVKLSALHPRYEAVSHARVMRELVPRLIALAQQGEEL